MRQITAISAIFLLASVAAYAAEKGAPAKKDMASSTPMIDMNPMTLPIKGLKGVEPRVYTFHIEAANRDVLSSICAKVPRLIDGVVMEFRKDPPPVTKRNVVDPPTLNRRFKEVLFKLVPESSIKSVASEEGGSGGTGGVIDRLPNMCK
jgi:hypothetical protein